LIEAADLKLFLWKSFK